MHLLAETVADALKAHGVQVTTDAVLEGRSGEVFTVPLLAEAEGRALLLWPDLDGTADHAKLAALRSDLGADGVVLLGAPDAPPEEYDGITCWDRYTLATILGEAILLECGMEASPLPWPARFGATDLSATLPAAFTAPDPGTFEAPEAPSMPWRGMDLEPDPSEGPAGAPLTDIEPAFDPDPFADEVPGAGAGASDVADDEPAPFPVPGDAELQWDLHAKEPEPTSRRLPVLVTPRQAQAIAAERMFTVDRYELALQPVHLFDAEVDVLRQGRLDADSEDCRLQVHGTDRMVTLVDPTAIDMSAADLLPAGHQIPTTERPLRVRPHRAEEAARHHLKEAFTRVVEVPSGDGDLFSYTERKRVAPRDDQVRVRSLGLFLRPVWRLLGPSGAMEIDAMDGTPLEAQVRGYPDAVMLE